MRSSLLGEHIILARNRTSDALTANQRTQSRTMIPTQALSRKKPIFLPTKSQKRFNIRQSLNDIYVSK